MLFVAGMMHPDITMQDLVHVSQCKCYYCSELIAIYRRFKEYSIIYGSGGGGGGGGTKHVKEMYKYFL